MTTPRPFGVRLYETRRAFGVTQEELGRVVGTHRVTIARWETGASVPRGIVLRVMEAWIAAGGAARKEARKRGRHGS